jgi:hypothetical protein
MMEVASMVVKTIVVLEVRKGSLWYYVDGNREDAVR